MLSPERRGPWAPALMALPALAQAGGRIRPCLNPQPEEGRRECWSSLDNGPGTRTEQGWATGVRCPPDPSGRPS